MGGPSAALLSAAAISKQGASAASIVHVHRVPTSWATAFEENAPEPPRTEPAWWRQKVLMAHREVKQLREKELHAVVMKAAHERAVKRAFLREQKADKGTSRYREEVHQHQPALPLDNLEDMQARLKLLENAHGSIDIEKHESQEMLRHDDLADLYRKFLIQCRDAEKEFEDVEDEAYQQGDAIMGRPYNTAADADAMNCERLRITSKEACEDEVNTVFMSGRCYVAGGDMSADQTPAEGVAYFRALASKERMEQAESKWEYAKHIEKKMEGEHKEDTTLQKYKDLVSRSEQDLQSARDAYKKDQIALEKAHDEALKEKEKAREEAHEMTEVKARGAQGDTNEALLQISVQTNGKKGNGSSRNHEALLQISNDTSAKTDKADVVQMPWQLHEALPKRGTRVFL